MLQTLIKKKKCSEDIIYILFVSYYMLIVHFALNNLN
jgi:hypothetical protein